MPKIVADPSHLVSAGTLIHLIQLDIIPVPGNWISTKKGVTKKYKPKVVNGGKVVRLKTDEKGNFL